MEKKAWVLLFLAMGMLRSSGFGQDVRYDLYLTRVAAAEAFLQLNKISTAREYLDACDPKFRDLEWNFLNAALDQSSHSITRSPAVAFHAVKVSPDGSTVALAGSDSLVSLYTYPELRKIRDLKGHRQSVVSLDFSRDGTRLVSGGRDHAVIVWEVATGKELLRNDTSFSQGIYQVRFSPDGRQLGVVSWERLPERPPHIFGFAKLLDSETGRETMRIELDNHPASTILFGKDGKTLLISSWGEIAYAYDLSTGAQNWTFDLSDREEYNAFHSADLSPDGKLLALGSTDHRVYLLDVASGAVKHRIEPWQGHSKTVKAVRFSPDGKFLATAGEDQSILLWEMDGMTRVNSLIGHINTVTGLDWSRDGKSIVSSSTDHTARTWELEGAFATSYTICDFGPWQTPLSADRSAFAAPCSDKKLAVYRIADGALLQDLGAQSGLCADLSKDGKTLVTASFDGVVRLWDLHSGKEVQALRGHTARVDGVAWMNGSGQALSVGDSTLRVWNAKTGREDQIVKLPSNPFRIVVQPSEKQAFVGFHDGAVIAYETGSWKENGRFKCDKPIEEMAMSPDGKLVAVFCGGQIELWDSRTLVRRQVLKGHEKSGYGIGFSTDGRYLISGSYDQTFKLWNLKTGRCTLTFHGYEEVIYTSKFVSSSEILVSTSQGMIFYYRF